MPSSMLASVYVKDFPSHINFADNYQGCDSDLSTQDLPRVDDGERELGVIYLPTDNEFKQRSALGELLPNLDDYGCGKSRVWYETNA
jgi:hypothetical protein